MLRDSRGHGIVQSHGSDALDPSRWGDTKYLPKTHEFKCGREKNAEVRNPKSVTVDKQRGSGYLMVDNIADCPTMMNYSLLNVENFEDTHKHFETDKVTHTVLSPRTDIGPC